MTGNDSSGSVPEITSSMLKIKTDKSKNFQN